MIFLFAFYLLGRAKKKMNKNDEIYEKKKKRYKCNHLLVNNLSSLDRSPLETLQVKRQGSHTSQNNGGLQTHLFTFIMFRFSSPSKESTDILGHLRGSGRSTIFKFNNTVKENTGHSNSTTGEIRVIIQTFTDFNTSGSINITCKKSKNVILTIHFNTVNSLVSTI